MPLPIEGLTLNMVALELGLPDNTTLYTCFLNATGAFDPLYEGNRDRLSNFRGYSGLLPQPQNISAAFTGGFRDPKFEVNCDPVAGATAYDSEYTENLPFPGTITNSATLPVIAFLPGAVLVGTKFYYRIRAVGGAWSVTSSETKT